MAKASGNTRVVRPTSGSIEHNRSVFGYETSMPDIVALQSYFSDKSGGYLLQMKGHIFDEVEHEAMVHLANAGFAIVATPEGGKSFITAIDKKGTPLYSDGLVMGNVFELKSPKPTETHQDALDNSVKKALNHAKNKGADVAVIYDKNGSYHRDNIERGLNNYESKSDYRFDAVLVVDKAGNVYEHIHNK